MKTWVCVLWMKAAGTLALLIVWRLVSVVSMMVQTWYSVSEWTMWRWCCILFCWFVSCLLFFYAYNNSGCWNLALELLFCYLACSLSLCLYLCYIYPGLWFVIWCDEAGYFQNKSLKLMGIDCEWMGALHGLYELGKIQILKDRG